jgi:hypothetical protein
VGEVKDHKFHEHSLFLTPCVFHFLQENAERLGEEIAANADKCTDGSNMVDRFSPSPVVSVSGVKTNEDKS